MSFEPIDPGFESELEPGQHVTATKGVAMVVPQADFRLVYGCDVPEGYTAYAYILRGESSARGDVNALRNRHLTAAGGRRSAARIVRYQSYFNQIIPTINKDSHQVGLVRGSMVRLKPRKIGHTHFAAQTHRMYPGQLYVVQGEVDHTILGFPKDVVEGDVLKVYGVTKGAIHTYFPRLDKIWRLHQYPEGAVLTRNLLLVRNTPIPVADQPRRWAQEEWHQAKQDDPKLLGDKPVVLNYRRSEVRAGSGQPWRNRNKTFKNFYAIPRRPE
jgi:hypothetical protein